VRGCAARSPRRAAPAGRAARCCGAGRRARARSARTLPPDARGADPTRRPRPAARRAGTLSVREMQKIIRRDNGQFHKLKEISTLVDAIDLDGDGEARAQRSATIDGQTTKGTFRNATHACAC
jgi:hypothetical protein